MFVPYLNNLKRFAKLDMLSRKNGSNVTNVSAHALLRKFCQ